MPKLSTNACAEANLNVNVRCSCFHSTSDPNSSASPSSVPHFIGEATPGGGGTCDPTVRNSAPTKPSGIQLASAMVPPGRVTRTSSAAVCG